MYKSPIEIITGKMVTRIDDEIYSAVQNVGINVDREELLKALEYDRGQFEKGYNEAIDDFVTKYKFCDNRSIQCRKALNCADCIAEQLKAGEQE